MDSFRQSLSRWTGVIFIFVFLLSCARSEFSTTHRVYRNGHFVTVNKPAREHRQGPARKTVKAAPTPQEATASASNRAEPISYMASTTGEVILSPPQTPVILPTGDAAPEVSGSGVTGTPPDTVIIIREKKPVPSTQKQSIATNIPTTGRQLEILGLIGLILGIIGLFIAGIPLGISATILGGIGLRKSKVKPEKFKGKGFAIAAIIIGIVALVGAIIVLVAAA